MLKNILEPKNRPALILISVALITVCCCCIILWIVLGTSGLGGFTGSCSFSSPTGREDWSYCYDDWTRGECSEHGEALGEDSSYSLLSCNTRGFTKQCPSERPTWRLPGYPCD